VEGMGPHGGGVEGEADKAAAEEGAPQGGSAGGGSQKAAKRRERRVPLRTARISQQATCMSTTVMSARCGGRQPKRTRRRTCASLTWPGV